MSENNLQENKTVPEKALDAEVKLPDPAHFVLSSSPHIHSGPDVRRIMLQVILCLLPAVIAAIVFFGLHAVKVILVCCASCVAFEYLWCKLLRKPDTTGDLSALLTGLILALNVSPRVPVWLCIAGSFVAIIVAKQIYGGLGQNPFNPAAVARIAMLIGATGPMTSWMNPAVILPPDCCIDAASTATPLSLASATHNMAGNSELLADYFSSAQFFTKAFIGQIGGSLGETSTLAILIGGIALIKLKLIRWQIPLAILSTVVIFVSLVNHFSPGTTPNAVFHLLTGGLMIGAFFMATDMVTSPVTVSGGILYGIGIGVIVCVIRIYGSFPEGMSFAIVIMNALVPLIDKLCYIRPFGYQNLNRVGMTPRRGEIK